MSEMKTPSVALLIKDLKIAKEVSNIFRAMDVLPYIYSEFQAFWYGTLEEVPTFCLIDVELFAEGDLSLSTHPHIKAQSLPIALYYNSKSSPLTISTFDTFNYGLISGDLPLAGQIKAVLKRVNKLTSLERQKREVEVKAQALQHQIDRVVRSTEKFKETDHYQQLLKRTLFTLDQLRGEVDFNHALAMGMEQLGFIENFALYELSFNAQKLIAPPVQSPKYKELPSLWLGQTGFQGIEFYAQNMASQVALDIIGPNLMSLLLKGKRNNPEVVLFVKTEDEEILNNLDWSVIEHYLTGLYSHYELKKGKIQSTDKRNLSPWEFYSFLDSCFMGNSAADDEMVESGDAPYSLINLSLSTLNETIAAQPLLRFYWSKFIEEFLTRFEGTKNHKFKYCCMGTENIVFIVDRNQSDMFFNDLKSFAIRFPIWRYFEEPEVVLAKNLKPEIRMVPLSTLAYQQYLSTRNAVETTVVAREQKSSIRPRSIEMTN